MKQHLTIRSLGIAAILLFMATGYGYGQAPGGAGGAAGPTGPAAEAGAPATAAAPAGAMVVGPTAAGPIVPQLITIPGPLPAGQPSATQAAAAVRAGALTPAQAEALQNLTPEQRAAVEAEAARPGGQAPPQVVETIKSVPGFEGLTTDEVAKGKELLDRKEKAGESAEKGKGEKKGPEKGEQAGKAKVIEATSAPKSLFDRYRSVGKYQDISTILYPFGYQFFQEAAVRVLTERKDVPVPSDYVIGPGDEVKILLWGRVNAQYTLPVDRNGNITIPQVGPLAVAGMTFDQMGKYLIKQAEQIVGTNIDVTMGSLKSIPIFVLGDVVRPGAYNVGSFATITDALLIGGGPSEIGSMRNVQLRRKDKVIAVFDLYDLLIKGDKSNDKMLEAGDVIFVPVTGPLAGIAGNVKRPAVYELKDRHDLEYLFDLAGGIIPMGYTQQIQVERIVKNERQIVVDIDDKNLTKSRFVNLQDGDLVKIFNVVDRDVNVVFVNGNVKRPGKYELKPGMRVRDLIKGTTDLLGETYVDYALIRRLHPPQLAAELIPFNLGKALARQEDGNNLELVAQDQIFVFSKWLFKDRPYITIEGEVRNGGRFGLVENMTLKDAILSAGGVTREAYLTQAELYRTDQNTKKITLQRFDVKKVMEGDPDCNVLLKDLDRIVFQSILGYEYRKTVSIDGAVMKPGSYAYAEKMTVKDLVFAAGNILESAYLDGAEVSSQVIVDDKLVRTVHRAINLRKALEGLPEDNVFLRPYDRVSVKRLSNWGRERFATVSGEVRFPGTYTLKETEKLSDLIERAGGYKETAYLRAAVFTRQSVKELQQKNLEEMIARMERELLAESSTISSTSRETVDARKIELQQKQAFIESLRKLRAMGRMTVRVAHLRLLKGSEFDIPLENGDSLFIPMNNRVVNVMGAVMSNASLVYSDKAGPKDYVRMAGGYSRYADAKHMYVLKVDGSARKMWGGLINWSGSKDRWELVGFGGEERPIESGDTIVVPEKLERIAWLSEIKDITQIMAQLATSMGIVYLITK